MARVRRTKAGAANAPSQFELDAAGKFDGLPFVLTVEAVKAGAMPPLGSSGMPASLEAHVPPELRFWKATDESVARDARDALVDAAIFKVGDVRVIDGVHQLVTHRTYVAPVYAEKADAPLAARVPALVQATSTLMLLADKPVAALKGTTADLAELDDRTAWIVELDAVSVDASAIMAKMAEPGVRAFELETRSGAVFVTNVPARKRAPYVLPFTAPVETTKRHVRLLAKADASEAEERYVLGVVLEPDVIDSQNDTYDAATIRAAAHGFMQHYKNVGLQHQAYVTGKIEILESYLAPADMEINGQAVKAGTWLMGLRFVDDGLWEQVKSGALTGLSIGGTAVREPEPDASALAPA